MQIKKIFREIIKNPTILIRAPLAIILTCFLGELAYLAVKLGRKPFFHRLMTIWSNALCLILGIRINCSDLPPLANDQAYIFIANHQTWLDILVIAATLPVNTVWIAKKEIAKIPILGRAIKAGGFMFTSRGKDKKEALFILEQSTKYLREGLSIFIFPEGTRSRDDNLGCFKSGAFYTAKAAPAEIVPINVTTHHLLEEGSFTPKRLPAIISFGEIINLEDINQRSIYELKDLAKTRILALR